MRFITSIIHKVEEITAATTYCCTSLGFNIKDQSTSWTIIDNGSIAIRLVTAENATEASNRLNLELQTKQQAEDTKELLSYPGVSLIAERISESPDRIENRFQCPHGLVISLIREFNEDELGIIPPLPTTLVWGVDAEECIKQILRVVPLSFRDQARIRITEKAEMLVAGKGSISVNIDCAVQALAEATPHFQHPAIEAGLHERGIDPLGYFVRDIS